MTIRIRDIMQKDITNAKNVRNLQTICKTLKCEDFTQVRNFHFDFSAEDTISPLRMQNCKKKIFRPCEFTLFSSHIGLLA